MKDNGVEQLIDVFVENPIIGALRDKSMLESVIEAEPKVVFMLFGSIGEIEEQCNRLTEAGKLVFLHVDLIEGLRADSVGIKYIANTAKPTGIITTKGSTVKMAHDAGLAAIQRIFVIDSAALKSGAKNVSSSHPDFVEILPGVSDKLLKMGAEKISIPLIAGGLIYTKDDVISAIKAGVVACSTSNEGLWNMGE